MNVFAVMAAKLQKLIDNTSMGLEFSMPDDVDWTKPHVFVSNHRDILLDAALLNMVFFRCGLNQPASLAGTNLMTHPLMVKFSRLNKVFCMDRGDGSKRAFYENMKLTSDRIRQYVDEGTSVWVAQRNGRTKDGFDKTDPAVLKMLCLSGKDKMESLLELGVTPMSISYEAEPCAFQKAHEMMVRQKTGEYHKAPHEDEQSMLSGLQQQKGRIRLAIGHPLTREQLQDAADPVQRAAEILDEQIWSNYHLWPHNYLAASQLGLTGIDGNPLVSNEFSQEEIDDFNFVKALVSDPEQWQWVLRISAGPVMSKAFGATAKQQLELQLGHLTRTER